MISSQLLKLTAVGASTSNRYALNLAPVCYASLVIYLHLFTLTHPAEFALIINHCPDPRGLFSLLLAY